MLAPILQLRKRRRPETQPRSHVKSTLGKGWTDARAHVLSPSAQCFWCPREKQRGGKTHLHEDNLSGSEGRTAAPLTPFCVLETTVPLLQTRWLPSRLPLYLRFSESSLALPSHSSGEAL